MNKKQIMVIAPHADDEILGCGGTIFKEVAAGNQVHLLLVTKGYPEQGFSQQALEAKESEIEAAVSKVPYASFKRLDLPAVALETIPRSEIIQAINQHIRARQIDTLYLPFGQDVHSDHRVVFESAWAAAKAFRAPTVKEIFSYEVVSETGFQAPSADSAFNPNTFVDITDTLDQKIAAFQLYASEVQTFPAPRSAEVLRALAIYRGSVVNCAAAEAFLCLRMVK